LQVLYSCLTRDILLDMSSSCSIPGPEDEEDVIQPSKCPPSMTNVVTLQNILQTLDRPNSRMQLNPLLVPEGRPFPRNTPEDSPRFPTEHWSW
jgi:hypothetical protein